MTPLQEVARANAVVRSSEDRRKRIQAQWALDQKDRRTATQDRRQCSYWTSEVWIGGGCLPSVQCSSALGHEGGHTL